MAKSSPHRKKRKFLKPLKVIVSALLTTMLPTSSYAALDNVTIIPDSHIVSLSEQQLQQKPLLIQPAKQKTHQSVLASHSSHYSHSSHSSHSSHYSSSW